MPALFFLEWPTADSSGLVPRPIRSTAAQYPLEIALPLRSDFQELSLGAPQDQFSFSIDPARPDVQNTSTRFLIRLKTSREMKRIEMPAQIGLAFDSGGVLRFSDDVSSFWLDCRFLDHNILASLAYRTPAGTIETMAEWTPSAMETPLQTADEFAQDNPFRELVDSKWWGPDLLLQRVRGQEIHRLEVGPQTSSRILDCQVGDWLVFRGKSWEKCAPPTLESNGGANPIAHVVSANLQSLEIEGWKDMSHLRFRLNLASSAPFKIKTDELFSQLRVRSEKQVSCTIEKQCLVLRPGDWVVKNGGRWKTLRKAEEKEGLLLGEISGEVFILEKIGVASSAKNIVGYYFSAGRTQGTTVEVAQRTQKNRKGSR